MGEYPPRPAAGPQQANQQRRFAGAMDPRSYDPRRVMDQPHMREQVQRLSRAQEVARAQAQATSMVFLATTVSLATSAFGVVAAFAWNQAIQDNLGDLVKANGFFGIRLSPHAAEIVYAVIITIIAVIVILTLNRVARRIARKSAIEAGMVDAATL